MRQGGCGEKETGAMETVGQVPVFQDKKYSDQSIQAVSIAKDSTSQSDLIETRHNTTQHTQVKIRNTATQASRVVHHAATQHNTLSCDTCKLLDNELESSSNDSAIDMESDDRLVIDAGVQCQVEVVSRECQQSIVTRDAVTQVEIPDSKVPQLQEQISDFEKQKVYVSKMLSHFYIPVQCSDMSHDVELLREYLNNMTPEPATSDTMSTGNTGLRSVALYPGDEKGSEQDSFLTAANNSPESLNRQSDVSRRESLLSSRRDLEDGRFSSIDSDGIFSSYDINEDLRSKLDLAYKVIQIWDSF